MKFKAIVAAALTAIAVLLSVPQAWAEPAPIDDGSGPISNGAAIDDGSGPPGPSFDEPVSIPDRPSHPGPNATAAELKEYEEGVRAHDSAVAQERARVAAKAYRDCINSPRENKVC